MIKKTIDINCDLGECNDETSLESELEILPLISSANICCGFHSGNSSMIEKVIKAAIEEKVSIGAHPSFPDRAGFGRREMEIEVTQLSGLIQIQLEKIQQICQTNGTKLKYVKPHGALYNMAMQSSNEAQAIISAILQTNSELKLMGQANSVLEKLAKENQISFIREGFIDRQYQKNGQLMPRSINGSLIQSAEEAMIQSCLMVTSQSVMAEGKKIEMPVDSLCIHGDNPAAQSILAAVVQEFDRLQIEITSFA